MYSSFEYYTPTKVIFGKDAELQAGAQLKKAGAKKDPRKRFLRCGNRTMAALRVRTWDPRGKNQTYYSMCMAQCKKRLFCL